MDDKLKGRLERAVKHSLDFLFGLPVHYSDYSKGRQLRIYDWLRKEGKKKWGEVFDFKNGTYDEVTSQLIENPGIEKLVTDIIVPRVYALFTKDILDDLRTDWYNGFRPNEAFIRRYRLNQETAFPFLNVTESKDLLFLNVDGWGIQFSTLWFEDIEPWINESKDKKVELPI